ncbi:MAG: hypothetical protein ACOYL3_12795 [Desulfuromonadaceae bacterium]
MNLKKTVVIAAAAGALTALAIPAMAETTLYGSFRLATTYDTSTAAYDNSAKEPGQHGNLDLRNQANSRFGAKFSEGKMGGQVELGLGGLSAQQPAGNVSGTGASIGSGSNTTVYTRLVYGTYKFDFGTLLVGQTYTPYWAVSDQVASDDQGNNGFGSIYDGRQPQIRLTLSNGLYVAAIRPGTPATVYATANTYLPKVAVGYDGKSGDFTYGGGVAGQSYTYRSTTNSNNEDVTSVLGYVHGKYKSGPIALGLNLGYGQNIGDMGITEGISPTWSVARNTLDDIKTFTLLLTGGFTLSDTVKIQAGVGYVTNDGGKTAAGTDWKNADNKISAYVNAPITIAKNFIVVPEFTYQDHLDDNNAANTDRNGQKDYIVGAKWQFDF